MDVLKPPTDNLYKFISIFGLIIFVVSVAAPYVASEQLLNLTAGMEKANTDLAALLEEDDRRFARLIEVVKSTRSVPGEADRILNEMQEGVRQRRGLLTAFDAAEKFAETRSKTLLGVVWWSDVGKVIGIICIFSGFTLWYFKLQRYQDLLLRNQALAPAKEAVAKVDETPTATD